MVRCVEQQVIDLQQRVAFQEQALQTMSGQMAAQDCEINRLNRLLLELNRKLSDLNGQVAGLTKAPAESRPPHY